MSDVGLLIWGMMIGSWLTSLFIMRKDTTQHNPSADAALKTMYTLSRQIKDAERFAPDASISCEQIVTINRRDFKVTLAPVEGV